MSLIDEMVANPPTEQSLADLAANSKDYRGRMIRDLTRDDLLVVIGFQMLKMRAKDESISAAWGAHRKMFDVVIGRP